MKPHMNKVQLQNNTFSYFLYNTIPFKLLVDINGSFIHYITKRILKSKLKKIYIMLYKKK